MGKVLEVVGDYSIEQCGVLSPEGRLLYPEYARVVYHPTGEESALYTVPECREIISNAQTNNLKGSFLS